MQLRTALVTTVLNVWWLMLPTLGQEKPRVDPAPGTPSVLPRPDFPFPGNIGRTIFDSDKPQFPQPVQPPKMPRMLCTQCTAPAAGGTRTDSNDSTDTDDLPR